MSKSKIHKNRKLEIINVAEKLFMTQGYRETTVRDILDKIGIAKGTFYHYFKSKEEVMNLSITLMIEKGVEKAKVIANNKNLSVHEKFLKIIMAQKLDDNTKKEMIPELHKVTNAIMHQKSLEEIVKKLTPILVEVIKQGINEGIFYTPYPKETIEFLLVSSHIFDKGTFDLDQNEMIKRVKAFIHIMEVTLGAKKGSFTYMSKVFKEELENDSN